LADEISTTKRSPKVTVVGCGAVGMASVYAMLNREVGGEVVIADIDKKKLEGEVMDLSHSGGFLNASVRAAGDDFAGTENSDVVIITAGVRQREDESRRSLLDRNVSVLRAIIPPLVEKSPDTLILVVSNPCDTLTYVAWKLSGLPRSHVFGSGTFLDSSRFRVAIASKIGLNPMSVHAWIIGEHGDSSVPVWSGINIAGIPIDEAINDCHASWASLHKEVLSSASTVIKCKGYTNWAIGAAVCNIVECIFHNECRVIPLSTLVQGLHGIEEEVFLSLPCVLSQGGIMNVLDQPLSQNETAMLKKSAMEMAELQSSLNVPL